MENPPSILRRLVAALVEQDYAGIEQLFAPDVHFRALTPGSTAAADTAAEAVAILQSWFRDATDLQLVECGVVEVHGRWRLSYRLSGVGEGRPFSVEQQAYCDVSGELVHRMDVLCSGFRVPADAGAVGEPRVHHFDAGDLGCGTGLPAEFRRQLAAVAPGEMLAVTTRDAAAREDLPALARLLGHRVLGAAAEPDGSITITVERIR